MAPPLILLTPADRAFDICDSGQWRHNPNLRSRLSRRRQSHLHHPHRSGWSDLWLLGDAPASVPLGPCHRRSRRSWPLLVGHGRGVLDGQSRRSNLYRLLIRRRFYRFMIRLCRIDDLSYLPRSTLTGRLGRVWTASIPDYSRWSGSASTRNIAPSPIACPCPKRPSTRACKRRRRATGCTFSPFVVSTA